MHHKPETVSKNILLVAITRLGDMLQATPTIAGLKEEHPGARICVLIDRSFAKICDYLPGIDKVYEIDLHFIVRALAREGDGIVDAYRYLDTLIADLKAEGFDYCLNMSSSGYTALLITLLGIEENRGWVSTDSGERLITTPWAQLFAAMIFHQNRDFNSINLVDYFRCSAGVEKHPEKLLCTVPDRAMSFACEYLEARLPNNGKPLIAIQAGASQAKRQWSPDNFATLAKELIDKLDARILFTGSQEERGIIDQIFESYRHPNMYNGAGETNLEQLTGLLKSCDLLITGDTGPMHIAVGVGTPVVAVFLASGYCFETGPYGEGNLVVQPQITCNPCNPNYQCSRPDCHLQVTPALVSHLVQIRLATKNSELRGLRVPDSLAPPHDVAVYLTTFDEDGYLDYLQLNSDAGRRGYPAGFQRVARRAYRTLWKDEFRVKSAPKLLPEKLPNAATTSSMLPGIEGIIKFSEQGQQLVAELVALARDQQSSPQRLGEVGNAIESLDKSIEEFGMGIPHLGILTRMFTMEKENMMGDDIFKLASDKRDLYVSIGRRAQKFDKLFCYFNERKEEV